MLLAFGGPIAFQGFCGSHHVRRSNIKFLDRLNNKSKSCFVGFRCFGNTSCSFQFAFICIHVPSFSRHLQAYSFHFAFISCLFLSLSFHVLCLCINFHIRSNSFHFHSPCPLMFLSFACIFFSSYTHVRSLPFQNHGNGSLAWPWDQMQPSYRQGYR